MIKLPKVKLEYGRSSVKYMGAKLFNDLPLDLSEKITDGNFKNYSEAISGLDHSLSDIFCMLAWSLLEVFSE